MSRFVRSLQAVGIHKHLDLYQEFRPGVNIVYGKNGSGKTTLLHILANALNGHFERFAFLEFKTISITLDDGQTIELTRRADQDQVSRHKLVKDSIVTVTIDGRLADTFSVTEVENLEPSLLSPTLVEFPELSSRRQDEPVLPTTYVPSFRVAVEAWKAVLRTGYSTTTNKETNEDLSARVTYLVRKWLLPFVPKVDYPTVQEAESYLSHEASPTGYSAKAVSRYLETVNGLLEGKRIVFKRSGVDGASFGVETEFPDGIRVRGLVALSSGEREIASLLYAAMPVGTNEVILVDEPEISLHVDWQRVLLRKMLEQANHCQIIACTHSPMVGADFEERVLPIGCAPQPRSDIDTDLAVENGHSEIPF
jgi:predicted ATPase